MTICNKPKRTIFTSSELRLLQMVLELDTEQYPIKDVVFCNGMDGEIPHWLERNEVFLMVWKTLPSRRVLTGYVLALASRF